MVFTFRRIRGLAELYICGHELEVTSGIFKIFLGDMCRCRGRQTLGILCKHTYSDRIRWSSQYFVDGPRADVP